MRLRMAVVRFAIGLMTFFSSVGSAGDIRLTLQNDVTVILHGDRTWSCSDPAARKELADMTIRLEDGREVHLGAKGRWAFVERDSAATADGTVRLTHTGIGRSQEAQKAAAHAKELALSGLAKRMRRMVGAKVSDKELRACIEDMDKLVEQQEKYVNGMFEVKYTITLDHEMIDAVRECTSLVERLGDDTQRTTDTSASRADTATSGK